MSRVVEEVRKQTAHLTGPGLVAVSGGPDSVALLRAMKEACPVPFTVVHVNHKLRGEESEEDERFVVALCEKLEIPFCVFERPILSETAIEEKARDLRIATYHELKNVSGYQWFATGHTADDQAETILHRIARGTGIAGLQGIESHSHVNSGLLTVRPLLRLRRNELIKYLDQLGQPFRIDSSNSDPRFTRNRIRHELLPLLREINAEVDSALVRLGEQCLETQEYVIRQARDLLVQARLPSAGEVFVLHRIMLEQSERLLVRELFRIVWQSHNWPMGNMTTDHWTRLGQLKPGDYPSGVTVSITGKVVQLSRKP